MATSTSSNETQGALLEPVLTTARSVFIGLAWAALMLFVLGFWNRAKAGGAASTVTYLIFALGVVAAALALWQAFTVWIKSEGPQQKAASLENQHRLLSYIIMAGGIALIVLAVVLSIGPKTGGSMGFVLSNFAESCGVLLFGLVALGSGYALTKPSQPETGAPIQWLTLKLPILKVLQLVLGVAAISTFFWLYFAHRVNDRYLDFKPEFAGLLALSILSVTCLLWLNTGETSETGTRLFVLVFGGGIGLILFVYSFARSISWSDDIYIGGMAAWQGDNAWHFWLVAYLQFIALALMFGSFNLARADIRSNVVLRRVMYGYDTLLQALLLIEILAVMNVVIYAKVPFSWDWTKSRGAYALSDSTKNLISKLREEAHIIVIMPQNDPTFRDVRNLMNNSRALSNKLQVDYVSPDTDPQRYRSLVQVFPTIMPDSSFGSSGRGVLVVYGPMPQEDKRTNKYAFISERKLVEEDMSGRRGGKSKRIFKGEAEIMSSLKFLVGDQKKRKVYILQGDDEPDINVDTLALRRTYQKELLQLGFGALVEKLTKDNMEVLGLSFGQEVLKTKEPKKTPVVYVKGEGEDEKRKDVPKDCDVLVVAGVPRSLAPETVGAVERYMEKGGKMVVCLDVFADEQFSSLKNTGLEPLLKTYGVNVTDTFALAIRDPIGRSDASTLLALGAPKSDHPLARPFVGRSIVMPNSARVLTTPETPGRFKAEPVLQLELNPSRMRFSIAEKDVRSLRNEDAYVFELARRNLLLNKINESPLNTVAVAVTDTKDNKPRMVVVGDTEFTVNIGLRDPEMQLNNYSFIASALEWMAEREGIGAVPSESTQYSIDRSVDTWRMTWVPGWLMFLSLVSLGVGVWVVRRR